MLWKLYLWIPLISTNYFCLENNWQWYQVGSQWLFAFWKLNWQSSPILVRYSHTHISRRRCTFICNILKRQVTWKLSAFLSFYLSIQFNMLEMHGITENKNQQAGTEGKLILDTIWTMLRHQFSTSQIHVSWSFRSTNLHRQYWQLQGHSCIQVIRH